MSFASHIQCKSLLQKGQKRNGWDVAFYIYIYMPTFDVVFCGSRLTWVRHSSCKTSATHSYQRVQYFGMFKQWFGCQCLGFLMCAQMLMYTIAYVGCEDTVRESAQKVDSGRKSISLAAAGTRTRVSIAPGFSLGRSNN